MPAARPETVIVAPEDVPVFPPGEEVAVKEVMAAPPLEPGAVKETVALVDPVAVAVPIVGAPGTTADVVTEFEAAEAREVPTLLVAVTLKV